MSVIIWHIEFRQSINGKRHWYFGSISAIFKTFNYIEIGYGKRSVYNKTAKKSIGFTMETDTCVITKGELIRSLNDNFLLV